jgi:hypothetical protein
LTLEKGKNVKTGELQYAEPAEQSKQESEPAEQQSEPE